MIVNFETKPLPVHEGFHRSTLYERMLFGAFGSGKTYAVIDEAIAWCLEQPGIRGLIARKTIPELRDTTEPIFRERLPAELWRAGEERRTGGHMESFTFPNGSVVLFRSLDDWNKHRSLNVGFIAYDEANEIDEETYMGMSSRVRQRELTAEARHRGYTGSITRRGIWGATNPNGKDWLWRRWHPDSPDRAPNTECFTSTTLDNPYLPPEYVESLLLYPKPWVQRYVLCQFDDFAGQIYEDWGWDTHVIEPYKVLPSGAVFWHGFDPGIRNNTAGLWVYFDQENRRLVGVREYQDNNIAIPKHAAAFRKIEADPRYRMRVRWRVSDPSIMIRDAGTNMSRHSQYQRLGFNFNLGPKTYPERIPALGSLILQNRFVVTKDCPMTYEAIKDYKWADLTPAQRAKGEDPREVPVKKNDHLVDCAQYLSSRWIKPLPLERPEVPEAEALTYEIHRVIRKQLRNKAIARTLSRSHDLGRLPV